MQIACRNKNLHANYYTKIITLAYINVNNFYVKKWQNSIFVHRKKQEFFGHFHDLVEFKGIQGQKLLLKKVKKIDNTSKNIYL